MKFKEFRLRTITIFQLSLATIIVLLFQFVFPYNWQPLDLAMYGPNIKHGDPNANIVAFTVSIWYFGLSFGVIIYPNNRFINNFLVYSIVPHVGIILVDFTYYLLFWDYIHLTPFIVDIYLIWKKRDTLDQKFVLPNLLFITTWLFTVYFLKLAYFGAPLNVFIWNWILNIGSGIILSFFWRKKKDYSFS
ncbi:MAG: hypothetical protein ACTSR8_17640 [Promethearchaeota archaeon]